MRASTKLILVLIILAVIGLLAYQFYTSTSSCWPFCPSLTDEENEALQEGFDQGNTNTPNANNNEAPNQELTKEERDQIEQDLIKAGCPDEMIVNKMPGPADDKSVRSYYIKDGKRVELAEYDSIWVKANCEVPVVEVW